MAYHEMDPDQVRRLLEGHVDILNGEVAKEAAYFRALTCPVCGAQAAQPFTNPQRPFTAGAYLSNKRARCSACQAEFDPDTGVITKAPPEPT
jgi:rubredoxin